MINYLSNGINILAGDDLVPVKFWHKDTDLPPPDRKDGRFTFHTRGAVHSAIADLLVLIDDSRRCLRLRRALRTIVTWHVAV